MEVGGITGYIDVAQITLYAFWIFFAGLIIYLRGEDRREGYPLVHDDPEPSSSQAVAVDRFPGAPLMPVGNPLLAGVGPGAWSKRADTPELIFEGLPKIVPLRAAAGYYVDPEGPDPRGYTVFGADNIAAGEVVEIWADRNELLVRYFELSVAGGSRRVLVPGPLAQVDATQRVLKVNSILASQFADVPTTSSSEQITALEEDHISAYYAAGTMYATPARLGPLL